jgi:hypothetical protein
MNHQIPGWVEKSIEKIVHTLQNDVVKKKIEILILEPFMSYVLERLFPYVLLLAVIFGIFIVMCALSIALLLYRSVPPVGAIGMGVAAASSMVA